MDVALFDYSLPEDRVAQVPARRRDGSRLMVLPGDGEVVEHRQFRDLPEFLTRGDLVVFNDTRVIPARLRARRPSGGRVELLLLEPVSGESPGHGEIWDCFLRSSRRVRPGEVLALKGGGSVQVIGRGEGGDARVHFQTPAGLDKKTVPPEETLLAYLERHGEIPLPPYIHRADPDDRRRLDRERYQTVFARSPGAVAAPTAGLHFTPRLLEELKGRGVQTASLTLHVGAGTFRPVTVSRAEDHLLPPERFVLPEATAVAITETRRRNGRVFACGTTVARVLEARGSGGMVVPGEGKCGLFILPGHRFRIIDGLLTNFHLPRSTLLMLVSALAGRRRVLKAYEEAVSRDYRFYSYGDAMLVFRHGQAT